MERIEVILALTRRIHHGKKHGKIKTEQDSNWLVIYFYGFVILLGLVCTFARKEKVNDEDDGTGICHEGMRYKVITVSILEPRYRIAHYIFIFKHQVKIIQVRNARMLISFYSSDVQSLCERIVC